ncbi:MAG: nucleotide sugar dehydrogenase [Bacteroidota bacterium]
MADQSLTRTTAVQGDHDLASLIERRRCRVTVVGAGHVGLTLAVQVARAGLRTVAYDTNASKVSQLNDARSYVGDVTNADLREVMEQGSFSASGDPDVLSQADVIIICVPTPLNKSKHPDNSFIIQAAAAIVPRMRAPQLIVLESTTFPGFTRDVLLPKLCSSGLELDRDFFLAFSPERADPGNHIYSTKNTPKVVGALSPTSLAIAVALYRTFIDTVIPVSSSEAAEMVKLLENTFRAVNIGLVNEIAMMCRRLGLDVWEVIAAAASKPFGFMPFHPGPGIGGHCIPVDPLLLSWKLGTLEYNARFIQLADEVNSSMPEYVVSRVSDALNERQKAMKGSHIMVIGVAYKRDVADIRESPALDIITLMNRRAAVVSYHDPLVPSLTLGGWHRDSSSLDDASACDAAVIVTDHGSIDFSALVERAPLVVDCRNATRDLRSTHGAKIVPL